MSARRKKEAALFYLFISPWILGFLAFTLGPMAASVYFSLTDWDSFTEPVFVGLDNYVRLLTDDPLFWQVLRNTFYYAGVAVPLGLLIGLWLANLLTKRVRMRKVFRTLIYLPTLVPLVATAMIFKMLLAPEGLVNDGLGILGIDGPSWLLDSIWSKPALIMLAVWQSGAATVLLMAAMKGIPREFYEAAEIDGASRVRQFWSITVPQVTPVIFFNLVTGMIAAFQVFSQVYILTEGGPNNSSQTMVPYLFNQAFSYYHMGYASAISWLLFLVILGLTLAVFRLSRRWVFYENEVK
ncbi:carbohydrate ABC transporter permease [Streptomyces sp. NBRC 109706]|uniref:carbohydrate ABC transporter permease n=1 Tax=Streptomyces sp. NBRC 109706 TaxID=1550035 RepID=UPI0007853492|nr:sugar ABC transporter permease [Streptomyces sp. NBRC 109706]